MHIKAYAIGVKAQGVATGEELWGMKQLSQYCIFSNFEDAKYAAEWYSSNDAYETYEAFEVDIVLGENL